MDFGKYFFWFAGILGAFLLFSCSNADSDKKIKIGFSQAMTNDDWRRSMNDAMRLQADLNESIDLTIVDADYQVQNQIEQIEKLIADSLDIIIVSPIQSKPVTPVVQKAMDAGIPVLVVDRKTENGNYTAYLGADNVEVGRNAAKEIIASKIKDTVRIIEIRGMAGSSPAAERSLGFRKVIDRYESVIVVDSIEGDWEKESIQQKFEERLRKDSSVDYVFAHNDRMARGAWEVARDLGIENSLKIIGVDGLNGSNGGIEMVENGLLQATVLYPTGGEEAIKLAQRILRNESVPKNNILTTTIINGLNAEIMKDQFDKINDQRAEIEGQLVAIERQEELYYSQNNLLKVTMALLAIILSLAVYSIYSIFTIRKRNRQLQLTNQKITVQRNQIQKIANKVKASNEAKLNFFTGLSHEFKTPITLILSATESMGELARNKGYQMKGELELVYNNSKRLLRLITQLLDFRAVGNREFTVRPSKTDLFDFSNNIFNDFKREAKKRNIEFKLKCDNENLQLYLDRNLMDKVYFNLLSNAFKFTPDNGIVEIEIIEDPKDLTVSIHFKDSGIGIPKSDMTHVFQPFFRGSNNQKNSSGIGLYLSKKFVELHQGKIEVRSLHGTEFIVTLLKGKSHFKEEELLTQKDLVDTQVIDFSDDWPNGNDYLVQAPNKDAEKYTILIIEDHHDLSLFLKKKLQSEYTIYLSDGTDAVAKAFEKIPDIILCDINLPGKNGFEVCEVLKKDLRTSHIPTIILTALGDQESYIKGLQAGADLYLTKPFSFSILVQSIKSLLYNREKLRFYYTNNIYMVGDTDGFGTIEQKFMAQLNTLIYDNLDHADFSVEQLAESLNISRVQLYRKVKALLGISISDYIGNLKLERARSMLETTNLNISEIAYATGFSSPNYFSTSFKNKFGTSPKDHRKSALDPVANNLDR